MGIQEQFEGKGISSFTISQNGKVIFKKNYTKTKIFIGILILIASFLLAICLYYPFLDGKPELKVCTTKECLQSTVALINCMNETANPCENFYEFACGTYETSYPSSTNENSWESFLSLKVKQRVKKFLVQEDEEYESKAIHKTRMFYRACSNYTKAEDNNNYESLSNVWKKLNLDVDYLKDSTPLEIEKVLAKIKVHLNLDIFLSLGIDDDPRNSSSHALLIVQNIEESEKLRKRNKRETTNVPNEESLPTFTKYFSLVVNRILNRNQTLNRSVCAHDLLKTSKDLNNFEEEFSEISRNSYLRYTPIPEIITLGKLQNITDLAGGQFKFNWTLYLREIFYEIEPKVYEQLTSENSDNYVMLIKNTDYLYDLMALLSETPTSILKMSILSHVVVFLEEYFPLADHLSSEYCFSLTSELFGMVTGYSMIDTLDNSSKAALTEMTENIKWALRKMIEKVSWMDDETKNATLRKLANTKTYFGYPDNYTNILTNLFENLNITEDYVENMLSYCTFASKSYGERLLIDRDSQNVEWSVTPDQVNAFNDNNMNAFYMPAAILLAPLYHKGLEALNYGSTGSTIGHELSHNYDNSGRLYNELGNVVEWWTNKSHVEYTKKAQCLASYYSNIRIVDHGRTFKVDGVVTLDENIADIVGLKEAYYAYQHYVNTHGQEPKLPGLEKYSHDQLFFLGFANQYCHYDWNDKPYDQLDTSTHSPNIIRVQGTLSLLPEFADAWSCQLGTPMNPNKERCEIW